MRHARESGYDVRPLARHLFAIGWALSLAVVGAVWVRSYFASDTLAHIGDGGRARGVQSSRGYLLFAAIELAPDFTSAQTGFSYNTGAPVGMERSTPFPPIAQLWGFTLASGNIPGPGPGGVRARVVIIPYWSAVALLGLLGAAKLAAVRSRRRGRRCIAAGLCVRCGYDLRASPERCPECGTPAAAAN
jgi:hypothetical protein